jgi:hypothetical protein
LGNYNSTAAFIKLFDKREILYFVKWADDNPDRFLGLVWIFPFYVQMWRQFPEVLSFDNTYNTNRFKLPFFHITGQICIDSVFNAAWGLIDNERLDGFQFLAESIHQLLNQHQLQTSDVAITDFNDAIKAALAAQFPDTQ